MFKKISQRVVNEVKITNVVKGPPKKTTKEKLKEWMHDKVINFCQVTSLHGYIHTVNKNYHWIERLLKKSLISIYDSKSKFQVDLDIGNIYRINRSNWSPMDFLELECRNSNDHCHRVHELCHIQSAISFCYDLHDEPNFHGSGRSYCGIDATTTKHDGQGIGSEIQINASLQGSRKRFRC